MKKSLSLTQEIRDNNGGRALHHLEARSDSMTVETCLDACEAKKYPLGGVEFGNECCQAQIYPPLLLQETDARLAQGAATRSEMIMDRQILTSAQSPVRGPQARFVEDPMCSTCIIEVSIRSWTDRRGAL
jgi:hypothetical protein